MQVYIRCPVLVLRRLSEKVKAGVKKALLLDR